MPKASGGLSQAVRDSKQAWEEDELEKDSPQPDYTSRPSPSAVARKKQENSGLNVTKMLSTLLLMEFERESPPPGAWEDWFEAKAYKYEIWDENGRPNNALVQRCVEKALAKFDTDAKASSWEEAQTIGRAIGATRAKVLMRHNEALDATDEVTTFDVSFDGEGKMVKTPVTKIVPNHRVRLDAVKMFHSVYGMNAPAKVDVVHDVSDRVAKMSTAELAEEAKQVSISLNEMLGLPAGIISIDHDKDGDIINVPGVEVEAED